LTNPVPVQLQGDLLTHRHPQAHLLVAVEPLFAGPGVTDSVHPMTRGRGLGEWLKVVLQEKIPHLPQLHGVGLLIIGGLQPVLKGRDLVVDGSGLLHELGLGDQPVYEGVRGAVQVAP
jgi:hypothetical protein